jgi:hypothetical protein
MSPERFAALLDAGTAEAPPAPLPAADLAAGRRRLRRRRAGAAGSAAVAAAVVAAIVGLATRGAEPRAVEPVTPPPSDASVVASCRQSQDGVGAVAALYGSGTPLVRAVVATDVQVVAALESADGTYWGTCTISQQASGFPASLETYPSDHSVQLRGLSEIARDYGYGTGCGLVDGKVVADCPTWILTWTDRLPAEVDAVRFDLADGTSPTVRSEGGYVVLNILHDRTAGVPLDQDGELDVDIAIRRITYLDADGEAIAADSYEAGDPHPVTVDGLPLLSAYPPLRGATVGS